MKFGNESELFGKEKDDSFAGSIGNIYQSFGGQEIYPTLEEKAAHLLYFVTKNHSFLDGNKRIAATMFLYFLDKNGVLFTEGKKLIDDHTLVALTIMIKEVTLWDNMNRWIVCWPLRVGCWWWRWSGWTFVPP